MTLTYTTVDRMLAVEPRVGSLLSVNCGQMVIFATDAEAEVNGALGKFYDVPVVSPASGNTVPLLTSIATDIAIYRLLSRRIFTQERLQDSVWPDKFKEAGDQLGAIKDGTMLLFDNSGTLIVDRTDIAEVYSSTMDYVPTFTELDSTEQRVDPQKIRDERDARDFYD